MNPVFDEPSVLYLSQQLRSCISAFDTFFSCLPTLNKLPGNDISLQPKLISFILGLLGKPFPLLAESINVGGLYENFPQSIKGRRGSNKNTM